MNSFAQRLWRLGNSVAVFLYRRSGGRIGGKAAGGCPVLLLTVVGRKSGTPHTVPVGYVRRDGAYYVAASAGGQRAEPQWIRNLRKMPYAEIQIGTTRKRVSVEVLRGDAREEAWREIIVATFPGFAKYEQKSGRKIAVARLTPVEAGRP